MALCGALAILCARPDPGRARRDADAGSLATLAAIAVFPLLLGSVVLTRFDLWPIALVLAALAALLWERHRLGFGILGLAVAAKLFPAVLVPLALSYVWQRRGRREALICLGVLVGVIALVFLPFVVLGADGVAYSLGRQLGRPLQVESLGSSFLLAAHHLVRARARDALEPRLPEPRRDAPCDPRDAADRGSARACSPGSGSGGRRPARSSSAGALPRSSPSSRSGRCSRRSS